MISRAHLQTWERYVTSVLDALEISIECGNISSDLKPQTKKVFISKRVVLYICNDSTTRFIFIRDKFEDLLANYYFLIPYGL